MCEPVTADAPQRDAGEPADQAGAGSAHAGRLLKHSDFERVYKQGRRLFSHHMTVFYLRQRDPQGRARVGLTVGKVLGGAVVRNRIKRRMREAVRARSGGLPDFVDVVINPKKSVLTMEFSALLAELAAALDAVARKMVVK